MFVYLSLCLYSTDEVTNSKVAPINHGQWGLFKQESDKIYLLIKISDSIKKSSLITDYKNNLLGTWKDLNPRYDSELLRADFRSVIC